MNFTGVKNRGRYALAWLADVWVLIKDVAGLFYEHVIKEALDRTGIMILGTFAFAIVAGLTGSLFWAGLAMFTAYQWGVSDGAPEIVCDECGENLSGDPTGNLTEK